MDDRMRRSLWSTQESLIPTSSTIQTYGRRNDVRLPDRLNGSSKYGIGQGDRDKPKSGILHIKGTLRTRTKVPKDKKDRISLNDGGQKASKIFLSTRHHSPDRSTSKT
ncbi:hypothetical protein A2U01_0033879, partial [Trifolium medium]|nr:hypothetical protein [Trifolium medium]